MNVNELIRCATVSAAVLCAAFVLIGCPAEEEETQAEAAAVDPRFASAEAILSYYNQLTGREPVNYAGLLDMMYAENATQQRLLAVAKFMKPMVELDQVMFQKFGEHFDPEAGDAMSEAVQPAKMKTVEPQRATAEQKDSDGRTQTVYFVKMKDRWWYSCYTLEYDPDVARADKQMGLSDLDVGTLNGRIQMVTTIANDVIRDIRAGQITSAEDARGAFLGQIIGQAMKDAARENARRPRTGE